MAERRHLRFSRDCLGYVLLFGRSRDHASHLLQNVGRKYSGSRYFALARVPFNIFGRGFSPECSLDPESHLDRPYHFVASTQECDGKRLCGPGRGGIVRSLLQHSTGTRWVGAATSLLAEDERQASEMLRWVSGL